MKRVIYLIPQAGKCVRGLGRENKKWRRMGRQGGNQGKDERHPHRVPWRICRLSWSVKEEMDLRTMLPMRDLPSCCCSASVTKIQRGTEHHCQHRQQKALSEKGIPPPPTPPHPWQKPLTLSLQDADAQNEMSVVLRVPRQHDINIFSIAKQNFTRSLIRTSSSLNTVK